MKISFPKYGAGELFVNERGARCIISSVIIGFFAGLCVSYLATPSAHINENVPRITSQWDYRPKKPVRAPAVFDGSGAEASEVMSPDPFVIDNSFWCNDGLLECAAHTFANLEPMVEDATTKAPLSGHARAVSAYD